MWTKNVSLTKTVAFQADLETVRQVIMQTWEYPQFIDSISSAKVIAKDDERNEVTFYANLIVPVQYTVITKKIAADRITFQQKSGFFASLDGGWKFTEQDDHIEGDYEVNLKVPMIASKKIVKQLMNINFPRMLDNFQTEVHRRYGLQNA
ncbi:SRPBCC family protein [Candidatus Uabimicrobium amorphum]|uniref:Coenzyme Q-binding protein COQ10 START domain-containing protein n=1 Tax=Uabimicrobium amorphum TaxID=2596890 RepID=A0A5S9F6J0_UABAM|nr:SRPBCC family protein [Candidatus Uabimicrobium amorphum]BBM87937.1 hypothetical protein UABAM_06352 [Candidatus Uabimicrobium amorphum]